jgi:hypothetical protein
MSDICAYLIDALREKYGGMEFTDQLGFPRDAYEILDVLLSLPGIAIVELPTSHSDKVWRFFDHGESEYVTTGHPYDEIRVSGIGTYTSAEARAFAAALLAAANAVEQPTAVDR